MKNRPASFPWMFVFPIVLIALLAIACGSSATITEGHQPTATEEVETTVEEAGETEPQSATSTPGPTSTPVATNTPKPTNTPQPTPTPTEIPYGALRKPFALGEFAQLTYEDSIEFEIGITSVLRGGEANQFVLNANMFNDPAPEGWEHLVVGVTVRYTGADNGLLSLTQDYFSVVTNGRLIDYYSMPVDTCCVGTEFDEVSLFSGGEANGHLVMQVYADDPNPLVGFGVSSDGKKGWFFSTEEIDPAEGDPFGQIPLPTSMPAQSAGTRQDPYKLGEVGQFSYDDRIHFELSVTRVMTGAEARKFVNDANMFNDPAPEGMEHIVVEVEVRYIGPDEGLFELDPYAWRMVTKGQIFDYYDKPVDTCCVGTELEVVLFPGGRATGVLIWQVYTDDPDPLLAFGLTSNGSQGWFFSLVNQ